MFCSVSVYLAVAAIVVIVCLSLFEDPGSVSNVIVNLRTFRNVHLVQTSICLHHCPVACNEKATSSSGLSTFLLSLHWLAKSLSSMTSLECLTLPATLWEGSRLNQGWQRYLNYIPFEHTPIQNVSSDKKHTHTYTHTHTHTHTHIWVTLLKRMQKMACNN